MGTANIKLGSTLPHKQINCERFDFSNILQYRLGLSCPLLKQKLKLCCFRLKYYYFVTPVVHQIYCVWVLEVACKQNNLQYLPQDSNWKIYVVNNAGVERQRIMEELNFLT